MPTTETEARDLGAKFRRMGLTPIRSPSRVFGGKRFHATDAAFGKRDAQEKAGKARRGGRLARVTLEVSPPSTKIYIVWTRSR